MSEQTTTETTKGCLGCLVILALIIIPLLMFGVNCDYEPTPEKDWTAERELQPKRKQMIDQLIHEGIVHRLDVRSGGATLVVSPAFSLLSFDDKATFTSVVWAYASTEASESIVIDIRDSRTNKRVGWHTEFGLEWH